MIILGLASTSNGDAAAALFIDQTLVAVADEASLTRIASNDFRLPWAATLSCLRHAGIQASQIDAIAVADAPPSIFKTPYAHWARLGQNPIAMMLDAVSGIQQRRRQHRHYPTMMQQLGINGLQPVAVDNALAQISAGYYLDAQYDAPVMPDTLFIGSSGNLQGAPAMLGVASNGRLQPLMYDYTLSYALHGMGAYLGFSPTEAAEGIALLARHGDPQRFDLGRLFMSGRKELPLNTQLVDPTGRRGWQHNGQHYPFTQGLVDWLGPPALDMPGLDPHAHYAAALCQLLERMLTERLKQLQTLAQRVSSPSGIRRVLLGGDFAAMRWLPQRWLKHDIIAQINSVPGDGAITAALGAAAWVAARHGIRLDPIRHAYWGPSYLNEECIAACKRHPAQPTFEIVKSPAKQAARLLADGQGVCWFQGRQETTPWPLGARAVLYTPNSPKRPLRCAKTEKAWTGFYPATLSISARQQARYTAEVGPTPFAERYSLLIETARGVLPEDLQHDGAAPLHSVEKAQNPVLHALLEELEKLTGQGIVAQLPLKTPQQTFAGSPADAIDAWLHGEQECLIMQDVLVRRS